MTFVSKRDGTLCFGSAFYSRKMIRVCSLNLKNVIRSLRFVHPYSSETLSSNIFSESKRFETTESLGHTRVFGDNETQSLEKERQAEVSTLRILKIPYSFESQIVNCIPFFFSLHKFQVHVWHALGRKCINPAEMTDEQWQHLYKLDVKHQRQKYCRYLQWKKQFKAEKLERTQKLRDMRKGDRERMIAERAANNSYCLWTWTQFVAIAYLSANNQ